MIYYCLFLIFQQTFPPPLHAIGFIFGRLKQDDVGQFDILHILVTNSFSEQMDFNITLISDD